MPSLPTSLIVVGLVAAWLVVLVPMVAKRREHVPDSDDDSAGFRVLRRASQSLRRRRPVMSRTAIVQDRAGKSYGDSADDVADDAADDVADDAADDDAEVADGFGDEELGDDEVGDDAFDGAAHDDESDGDAADGDGTGDDRARDDVRAEFQDEGDEVTAVVQDLDEPDAVREHAAADSATAEAARGPEDPPADRWADSGERVLRSRPRRSGGRPSARPRRAPVASYQRPAEQVWDEDPDREQRWDDRRDREQRWDDRRDRGERDGDQWRPVPVRPGRGGFDPRAAEQAKTYRYQQRRRVALGLLALTALCAVLGVLGVSLAWAGAVCSFVLLALYLAYLRRQVRIEEAIRQRRAARLERARQIRPVYRASVAEQVRAHRSGSLPRPDAIDEPDDEAPYRVNSHARPAASVPPAYYTRGVPVDLDDDDPAFDDLEYYRPVTYRRASGE